MKSQSILSGRHETIHWECVDTVNMPIKRVIPDLPGPQGIFFFEEVPTPNNFLVMDKLTCVNSVGPFGHGNMIIWLKNAILFYR